MPGIFGILRAVPLLVFGIIAYFVVVIAGTGALDKALISLVLPSGADFRFKIGDLLVLVGLLLLMVEIIKSTRSTVSTIVDHGLSILLFAALIVVFALSSKAGTPTFLIYIFLALVDVIAGFTVTITASKRDISIEGGH